MSEPIDSAPARRSVGKKLRFDTFARDNYTCRYCGKSPPLAILHIDHVIAVVEGGTNEPENLVTACSDCNLGKGRSLAPVPSGVLSMQDRLVNLQEAQEQLAAYRDFLIGVRALEEDAVERLADFWSGLFDSKHYLTEQGLCGLRVHLKTFPPEKIMEAMTIARARHSDPNVHLQYTGGILRNWRNALENPERAKLDENVRRAVAFWKRMPGGSGWMPYSGEADLRAGIKALGLEAVLDEMRAWGRCTYFESFAEHLVGLASASRPATEAG